MADTIRKEFKHPALEYSERKEKVEADFKMVYCDECHGRGTVDIDGLRGSAELDRMLAEDPDFEDNYFNTDMYQQPCPLCEGKKIHEVVVWDSLPRWVQELVHDWDVAEREHLAEVEAERRVGA